MRCIGRNRDFRRCNNFTSFLVCRRHVFQLVILLVITVPGSFGSYLYLIDFFTTKEKTKKDSTLVISLPHDSLMLFNTKNNILRTGSEQTEKPKRDSKLKLVDIGFIEPEGNQKKIILDIKLRNVGESVAFLKRINFNVEKNWELIPLLDEPLGYYPISYNYDVLLPLKNAPYTMSVDLSQEIRDNEVDRFTISLGNDSLIKQYLYHDLIFLIKLELIYDENNKFIKLNNLLACPGKSLTDTSSNVYKNIASTYFISDYPRYEKLILQNKIIISDLLKLKLIKNKRVENIMNAYLQYFPMTSSKD